MTTPVVQISKLCKSYGSFQVLDEIDSAIEPGKLVGFLGPNGAGKTTTIRILLGLLKATSGDAKLFGKCSRQFGHELRANVGYLPGDVGLYAHLTAMRTLKFWAAARGLNCDAEIKRLAEVFELPLKKRVRKFSTGMKQKLGLIQALMHRPRLLVLDEPTSALDPLVRQNVFAELRNVVAEGRTVLFSSHSLSEVEELCDDVVILRGGKIVEHQSIEVLRKRALRRVELVFRSEDSIPETAAFPDLVKLNSRAKNTCRCTWTGGIQDLLKWIASLDIVDAIIERPDLNDLFITYYSDEVNDSASTQDTQPTADGRATL